MASIFYNESDDTAINLSKSNHESIYRISKYHGPLFFLFLVLYAMPNKILEHSGQ